MHKHRGGYTLVEMLVVITVGAVLMGVAIGLIVSLLRAQAAVRDEMQQTGVLAALGQQFRDDVHQTVRIENADGPRLAMPDGASVVYEPAAAHITRNQEDAAGKLTRQETFALPPQSSAALEVRPQGGGTLVSLTIASAGRALRIEAVAAADHRLERSGQRPVAGGQKKAASAGK
jgi:prepilin-type N-terminal cleavage/methylation domain-containing protein